MDRNLISGILVLAFSFSALTAQAKPAEPQSHLSAAKSLIGRIAPEHEQNFELELINSNSDRDVFELQSRQDKIIIRGNNVQAMAVGLNWYLKYYCNTSVSWYASDAI